MKIFILLLILSILFAPLVFLIYRTHKHFKQMNYDQYLKDKKSILDDIGIPGYNTHFQIDSYVEVKQQRTFTKYDDIKYFKNNSGRVSDAYKVLRQREKDKAKVQNYLLNNRKIVKEYGKVAQELNTFLHTANTYNIQVNLISPEGNVLDTKVINVDFDRIKMLKKDPSLYIGAK